MAVYGYGRVSRDEQTSENQRQVIELQQKMQVDEWFEEHAVSGKVRAKDRPAFSAMLKKVKKGDCIIFTRVDRISRRASDTLNVVEELLEAGIEVYILQIGDVPLSGPLGKMMLGIFAIFAEGERMAIVERTKDGLARTKAQGTKMGRPLVISPDTMEEMMACRTSMSLPKMAAKFNHPMQTIDRNLKKWAGKLDEYRSEFMERQSQYADL